MKPPRKPRGLSGEDAFLWSEIARLITPLRGRAVPAKAKAHPAAPATAPPPSAVKPPPQGPALPKSKTPAPAHPAPLKPPPGKMPPKRVVKPVVPLLPFPAPALIVQAPSPPGLERRVRLALRRGALTVDARIDLHGMYQAEAHDALHGFLMRCRSAGHTHVLVVTGKGGAGYDDAFSERGVLRRSVPHWLRAPELRTVVLGFEEAARHHGGAGALYVRLRRR